MVREKVGRSASGSGDATDGGLFSADVDDDETISEVVVRTVASVTGDDPMTMVPLGTVVDSDALDALCARAPDDSRLSFSFNGCRVTVYGGRSVWARPERD